MKVLPLHALVFVCLFIFVAVLFCVKSFALDTGDPERFEAGDWHDGSCVLETPPSGQPRQ